MGRGDTERPFSIQVPTQSRRTDNYLLRDNPQPCGDWRRHNSSVWPTPKWGNLLVCLLTKNNRIHGYAAIFAVTVFDQGRNGVCGRGKTIRGALRSTLGDWHTRSNFTLRSEPNDLDSSSRPTSYHTNSHDRHQMTLHFATSRTHHASQFQFRNHR